MQKAPTGILSISSAAARLLALLSLGGGLSGCSITIEGVQSALDPRSSIAGEISQVWWAMFWGSLIILALVIALALYALKRRSRPSRLGHNSLIIVGGVLLPVVTLSALLSYGLNIGHDFKSGSAAPAELTIEVIGKRWWWEVRYPGQGNGPPAVSANEIHMPAGVPVEFALTTTDVIHSFWVPNLAGKIDMIPGKVNRVQIQADTPGVYRGQCAEYCGAQHAWMAFYVVVHPPEEFEAWLRNEQAPARTPDSTFLRQGRESFINTGCGACHVIRGVEGAVGTLGPDLTHVSSRLSLGAATVDNNLGTLAGWIADSHTMKPGNLMPPFAAFDGATLRAIAGYLESLE